MNKLGKSELKVLVSFLLIVAFVGFMSLSTIQDNFVSAEETNNGNDLEAPATEGYILDGYDDEKINVTTNQSHFTFETNEQNKTLKHIDVFLPEELKDDLRYVTACDPKNMICQGEDDYFHILNDWTNEYGDKFYIETDYIFDYSSNDGDNDIPEGFNWERINQEIRINYSENNTGIGDLLNTKYDITEDLSIKTDAFFKDNKLFINYTYYNKNDIVGNFIDDYDANLLNIKDQVSIRKNQTDFNNLNTKIHRDQAKTQMIKWDGEAVMNVSLTGDNPDSLALEDGKFIQDYEDYSTQFYPLNVTKDGGLEFLVELRNQTQNNVVSFDIEAPNLNFYYQAPLDEEMNNKSCNATHCEGSYRPEDVVGSYAIYHDSKKDNEYKTGKVYHLYRPKIIDEAGNWTWGELDYSNGKLDLTIPQGFLDNAVYPVRVDPTFGYESVGESTSGEYDYEGSIWTMPESGEVSKLTIYSDSAFTASEYTRGGIYDSGGNKEGQTEEISISSSGSTKWRDYEFSSNISLTGGEDYVILLAHSNNQGGGQFYYDSETDKGRYVDVGGYDTGDDLVSSVTFSTNSRKGSIYATYEASEEEDTTPPQFTTIPEDDSITYEDDWTGADFDAEDTDSEIDTWFINDTTNFNINQSGYLDDNPTLSAGNYSINVSVNDTEGNTNSTIYTLTVNKANPGLSLVANPSWTETYGTETEITGSDCPGQLTCNLFRDSNSVSNPDTQTLGAGDYAYEYNTTGNENYTSETQTNTLTIEKATPTASLTNDRSWSFTYDGTPANIGISESNTGDSDVEYDLWKDNTDVGASDSEASAGAYSYKINTTGGTNYTSADDMDTNTLDISKADPNLGISGTSPITYGTETDVSGSNCPSQLTCNLDPTNDYYGVGDVLFNYSTDGNENYTSDSATTTITINPKDLDVTADDKTKTYGDDDPSNSVTYDGFELDDDETNLDGSLSYSRESGQNVGTYDIEPSGQTAENYTLNYYNGTLTIEKRDIEITADDTSKTYDTSDPSLTHTITSGSLQYDDSVTGDLDREDGEAVGIYDINQNTLGIDDGNSGKNYDLTFVTGTFEITKATPSLSLSTTDSTYPNNFTIDASESNTGDSDLTYNLYVDSDNVDSGSSITYNDLLSAGTYDVEYNTTGGQNYTSNINTNTVTINKGTPSASLTNDKTWTETYPETVTIGYSESNTGDGDVSYTVLRDSSSVGSGETVELGAGSYDYEVDISEGANWTSVDNADTNTLTINKGSVNVDIYFSDDTTTVKNDNLTIEQGTELNVTSRINITKTDQIENSLFDLYQDGSEVGSLNTDYIEYLNSDLSLGTYYFNSTWDGNENYTSATRDPTVTVEDTISPSVSFFNQTPTDLTSDNLFNYSNRLNITYNITDDNLDTSTIKLNYKTNTSDYDTTYYLNGSAISGWIERDYDNNYGDIFEWLVPEWKIYPITHNLDKDLLTATEHSSYTLDSEKDWIKTRLFNTTSNSIHKYNYLELMANSSAETGSLGVWYCNSSYTSGVQPTKSDYCAKFYDLEPNKSYDYDENKSSYHKIPFTYNQSTLKIDNVKITNTSQFLLQGSKNTNWNVYTVPNITRADQVQTSTDGKTWNNYDGTTDLNLRMFNGYKYRYYGCANDTEDNQNCSEQRVETFELEPLPPTELTFYSPISKNYSNNILINYSEALSPSGNDITNYNISLVSENETVEKHIHNNELNTSYEWNSNEVEDGNYKIKVTACDNESLCSNFYSQEFEISKIKDFNITVINPKDGSEENSNPVLFKINTTSETVCNYNLNKGENKSMSSSDNITFTDSQDLTSDKDYTAYFFCNSTSDSNINDTANTSFYFRKESGGAGGGGSSGGIDEGTVGSEDTLGSFEVFKDVDKFYFNETNSIYIETYDDSGDKVDVNNITAELKENYNFTYNVLRVGEGKYKVNFQVEEEFESKKSLGLTFEVTQNSKKLDKTNYYTFYPQEEETTKEKIDNVKQSGLDFLNKYKSFILVGIGFLAVLILFFILIKNRNREQ